MQQVNKAMRSRRTTVPPIAAPIIMFLVVSLPVGAVEPAAVDDVGDMVVADVGVVFAVVTAVVYVIVIMPWAFVAEDAPG